MPPKNTPPKSSTNENFAQALAEVSDRLTKLVQDEIELAKAEVAQKTSSIARGAAAVAAGAIFGVFAVIFFLLTLAWVLDGIFVSGAGSLWLGFLIVLVVLLVLTVGAFTFAWRKLKVGAPTPKMAISEGKKIADTVTSFGANGNGNGHHSPNGNGNGNGHGPVTPERLAQIISPAVTAAQTAPAPVAPAPVIPASAGAGAAPAASAPAAADESPTLVTSPAPESRN